MLTALLILEDNDTDAELLIHGLTIELLGVRFARATTVREACEIVQNEDIDLAIVDLGVPDAHDLSAIYALRRCQDHLPILILTGRQSSALADRAVHIEGVDWMSKGSALNPTEIAHRVWRLWQRTERDEEPSHAPGPVAVYDRPVVHERRDENNDNGVQTWLRNALWGALGLVVAALVGLACWAFLDLKADVERKFTEGTQRYERLLEQVHGIATEQARRKGVVDSIDRLTQELLAIERLLGERSRTLAVMENRLQRLEQRQEWPQR